MNERTLNQIIDGNASHTSPASSGPQAAYRREVIYARIEELLVEHPDMTNAQARALATGEIAGLDALHAPDRIAGGDPRTFTGFEDSAAGDAINSAIGAQWRTRADGFIEALEAAFEDAGIPQELWGDIRVTVELTSGGAGWRP